MNEKAIVFGEGAEREERGGRGQRRNGLEIRKND